MKSPVNKALQVAEQFDSKKWVKHINAPDPYFVGYSVGPQTARDRCESTLRKEHRLLQEYTNAHKTKRVKAEGLLIQGVTIAMIIEDANKLNVDLIITGHYEHNFICKAFIGRV